jgi:Fe-S-cluster containining protein
VNESTASRRLLPLYRDIDGWAAKAAAGASCRRGCHHCCHNLVIVTVTEAIPIAEYLLASAEWRPRLPGLLAELRRQIRIVSELGGSQEDRTAVDWFARKIPCVFLQENGDCGVYPIRPTACRTYFVVSPPADCAPTRPGAQVHYLDASHVLSALWDEMATWGAPIEVASLPEVLAVALDRVTAPSRRSASASQAPP